MRFVQAATGGAGYPGPEGNHPLRDPAGAHAPFVDGDVVPVTLGFEKAGRIDVKIKVVSLSGDTGVHNH